MRALAVFASSEAGRFHAEVCRQWGTDPAASLEPIDDVLAANLRSALTITLAHDRRPQKDEASSHAELVEKARREAARLRSVT